MKTINLFAVGMLAMFLTTASFVSTGLAAHPSTERVDIIDHEDLPKDVAEKVEQQDSRYAKDPVAEAMSGDKPITRVDVKDINAEELQGPEYEYKKPMNR